MQRIRTGSTAALYTPVTLALVFIVATSYLGLGFVMPLRALYGREIGATSVEISAMASVFLLAGFLATPLIGWAIDRFSYRTILALGLLIHTCTTLAYIFAQNPWLLIALRAIEGIAAAGVLPPARALMNTITPRTRQGEALGLVSAAQTSGILIGPAAGAFLASRAGYALSFLLAASPLALGVVVTMLLLPAVHNQHGEYITRHTYDVSVIRMTDTSILGIWLGGVRELFSRSLNIAYLFQFLLFIANGVAASIWSLYMLDRGASLPMIGLSFTTFALPIIFLAPLAGRFSDCTGRYLPLVSGLLLCAITFTLYSLPLSPLWIVVISVLEGAALSIVRAGVDGYLADVMPGDQKGKVQATYNAAGTAGSLLGSVGAGLLYLQSPGLPFLAEGALFLAALLVVLLLPGLRTLFSESKTIALRDS
jgi:Arabinose efflux permease